MKKLLIECPNCRRINEGSTSFFAKRVLTCQCGNKIRVKDNRFITKECKHCGNMIVYDRFKNDDPICPVCHEHLLDKSDLHKFVEIVCPECSLHIVAKKDDLFLECPVCKQNIDVQKRLKEQEYIESAQPVILQKDISGDVCASKHHIENYRLGSQIVVNESQTAIFVADGKTVGVFGPGRHTIDTDNIYLDKTNFYNDDVTFVSKLYYISNVLKTGVRWGTDSKVRLFDPGSGLHVELGACGTFNYKISDPSKFVFNVIGLGNLENQDCFFEEINLKVKGNVISLVKSNLAKVLREESISCLELDEHIEEISKMLLEKINASLDKYGIRLVDFVVDRIVTPDDDPNFRRMKEQYAEQYLRVRQQKIDTSVLYAEHDKLMAKANNEMDVELYKAKAAAEIEKIKASAEAEAYKLKADAEAHEMNAKGYSYQDETSRKVAMSALENGALEGSSGTSDGIGLAEISKDAVKANIIGQVGEEISKEVVGSIIGKDKVVEQKPTSWTCPNCGTAGITSKFCPDCGSPRPEEEWECPECGTKGIKSKFCPNCGHKR